MDNKDNKDENKDQNLKVPPTYDDDADVKAKQDDEEGTAPAVVPTAPPSSSTTSSSSLQHAQPTPPPAPPSSSSSPGLGGQHRKHTSSPTIAGKTRVSRISRSDGGDASAPRPGAYYVKGDSEEFTLPNTNDGTNGEEDYGGSRTSTAWGNASSDLNASSSSQQNNQNNTRASGQFVKTISPSGRVDREHRKLASKQTAAVRRNSGSGHGRRSPVPPPSSSGSGGSGSANNSPNTTPTTGRASMSSGAGLPSMPGAYTSSPNNTATPRSSIPMPPSRRSVLEQKKIAAAVGGGGGGGGSVRPPTRRFSGGAARPTMPGELPTTPLVNTLENAAAIASASASATDANRQAAADAAAKNSSSRAHATTTTPGTITKPSRPDMSSAVAASGSGGAAAADDGMDGGAIPAALPGGSGSGSGRAAAPAAAPPATSLSSSNNNNNNNANDAKQRYINPNQTHYYNNNTNQSRLALADGNHNSFDDYSESAASAPSMPGIYGVGSQRRSNRIQSSNVSVDIDDDNYDTESLRLNVPSNTEYGAHNTPTGAVFVLNDGTVIMREPGHLSNQPAVSTAVQATAAPVLLAADAVQAIPPQPNQRSGGGGIGEEDDDNDKEGLNRSRIHTIFCVFGLILIVVVVAVVVAVVLGGNEKGGGGNGNEIVDPSATIAPTVDPEIIEQRTKVFSDVIRDNISSKESLEDENSPQSKALNWIISKDLMASSVFGKETMITRYVLAVFYFALNGPNWIDQGDWLDLDSDVCSWRYLNCSESKSTVAIDMDSNNLAGAIPSELQHIPTLSKL